MLRIYLKARILLCALSLASSSLQASNLFFSTAQGLVSGGPGFEGEFTYNDAFSSASRSYSNPVLDQSWSAIADLTAGQLKAVSSANNNGSNPAVSGGVTSVITAFGDTLVYSGTAIAGQNITANVSIAGTWATSASGDATLENTSYLRVYFLLPGSFDNGFLAPGNVISQAIWGIGPNAVVSPFLPDPVPYRGFISGFPRTVSMPVDIASLGSGFQVVVLLQTVLEGNTHGDGSFSWNTDLGHTLNVSLQAPDGVNLTSAGGLPTPEPSSILLAATGALLLVLRKRITRQ